MHYNVLTEDVFAFTYVTKQREHFTLLKATAVFWFVQNLNKNVQKMSCNTLSLYRHESMKL